ncbi:MAG: hypothetical protein ACI4NE_01020 [Succinivibrio sp.]
MLKPEHYSTKRIDENKVEISFTLDKSLFYLKGHFEKQPLLPGVVQIGWIYDFILELFGIEAATDIPVVKFMSPIIPDDNVTIEIEHVKDKKSFNFTYRLQSGKEASKGKVKYE